MCSVEKPTIQLLLFDPGDATYTLVHHQRLAAKDPGGIADLARHGDENVTLCSQEL
jgi:hypothetical protein